MKKISYILTLLLLAAVVFQSCEDQEAVDAPNFDVTFNKTAKVGDTIVFTIENAPNFLNFYSGDIGHEYKNRERFKAEGTYTLSFGTSRNFQDGASKTDNAWSLLMSTDYTGAATTDAVRAATWKDISDRFTFATARSYDITNSGLVDISDLATDKPVYFAVRILAEGKLVDGNRQGIFDLYSFDLKLETDDNRILELATISKPGWNPVNVAGTNTNSSYDNWVNRAPSYRLHGGLAQYTNEDWLISFPVSLSGAVPPDRGTPLKSYSDRLETFEYTYTEPGTYVVTFVGSNETIYGQKENTQEFTITVTE